MNGGGYLQMKKLNDKSKGEQLFLLMLVLAALAGVFCIAGCGGGKSCEQPSCGNEDMPGGKAIGCSIPGCGGILSSGKGCDSACWPQSEKLVAVWAEDEDGHEEEMAKIKMIACDTRYYGEGCLGCGQDEKSCYQGWIQWGDCSGDGAGGIFYGSSDSDEKLIGCVDGCIGCTEFDDLGAAWLYEIETLIEVD